MHSPTHRPSHHLRLSKHRDFAEATRNQPLKREHSPIIIKLPSPSPPPLFQSANDSAELPTADISSWSKSQIMQELITHVFAIPGSSKKRAWFTHVFYAHGVSTVIPQAYRIPLMYYAHCYWESARRALISGDWDAAATGIVHASHVCTTFLDAAYKEAASNGMGRSWRCLAMDRVLTRLRLGWFTSDPERLKAFIEKYGEAEYAKDPVKRILTDWRRLSVTGFEGFKLTEQQADHGMTAEDFLKGFYEIDGEWVYNSTPPPSGDTTFSAHAYLEAWRVTKVWGQDVKSHSLVGSPWSQATTVVASSRQTPVKPTTDSPRSEPPTTLPCPAPPLLSSEPTIASPNDTTVTPTAPSQYSETTPPLALPKPPPPRAWPSRLPQSLLLPTPPSPLRTLPPSVSYSAIKSNVPGIIETMSVLTDGARRVAALEAEMEGLKLRLEARRRVREYRACALVGSPDEDLFQKPGKAFWRNPVAHLTRADAPDLSADKMIVDTCGSVRSRRKVSLMDMDTS
ncbi:hypothetical protein BDZ89DRAFT_1161196 [Hymenopellis radicata]|nr:hypothetical protein BDZ89DRAFT_1161196 [Hymenopellis radicata]